MQDCLSVTQHVYERIRGSSLYSTFEDVENRTVTPASKATKNKCTLTVFLKLSTILLVCVLIVVTILMATLVCKHFKAIDLQRALQGQTGNSTTSSSHSSTESTGELENNTTWYTTVVPQEHSKVTTAEHTIHLSTSEPLIDKGKKREREQVFLYFTFIYLNFEQREQFIKSTSSQSKLPVPNS